MGNSRAGVDRRYSIGGSLNHASCRKCADDEPSGVAQLFAAHRLARLLVLDNTEYKHVVTVVELGAQHALVLRPLEVVPQRADAKEELDDQYPHHHRQQKRQNDI